MPASKNSLNLSDVDVDMDSDDLFVSPSQTEKQPDKVKPSALNNRNNSTQDPRDPPTDSPLDREEAREAALRRELAGIRNINEVIEGVVESLERAKGNMEVSWESIMK